MPNRVRQTGSLDLATCTHGFRLSRLGVLARFGKEQLGIDVCTRRMTTEVAPNEVRQQVEQRVGTCQPVNRAHAAPPNSARAVVSSVRSGTSTVLTRS